MMGQELTKTRNGDAIPAISHGPFTATPVGLIIKDGNVPYEEWETYGRGLARVGAAFYFCLGDWLNYGEKAYGEKYAQGMAETGLDYQTLKNAKWATKKVELSCRQDLSFQHHIDVASLRPEDQSILLLSAKKNDISEKDFRSVVKAYKRRKLLEAQVSRRKSSDSSLWLGDFRDLGEKIASGSVDLILTDPPYDDNALPLYSDVAQLAARVLRPGGLLLAYAGVYQLPKILGLMNAHLDYVWTISLVYSGGTDIFRKYGIEQGWKAILVYGRPPIEPWWDHLADVLQGGGQEKEEHEWQQAIAEATGLIKQLCPENGIVLDPMMGSGTTCLAAKTLGRKYIGIEIEEETYEKAAQRVNSKH
jgi:hypothetical protein